MTWSHTALAYHEFTPIPKIRDTTTRDRPPSREGLVLRGSCTVITRSNRQCLDVNGGCTIYDVQMDKIMCEHRM